jgi:uncharacterized membrane protein
MTPLTSQTTSVFAAFSTVAVNGSDPPVATATDAGEMATVACGGVIVTAAAADTLEFASRTAVTLTVAGVGTAVGAV